MKKNTENRVSKNHFLKSVGISVFFFLLTQFGFAQNEQLAQNYFDRGEFEKALVSYEELMKMQPANSQYFQKVVDCNQQLLHFDVAEKLLQERFNKYQQSTYLVELGYNFQLQKNQIKANTAA